VATVAELEAAARAALDPAVFDFFAGGADDEATLRANRAAWEAAPAGPHTGASQSVGVAPMGYQGLLHRDAELATARGAEAAGALNIVSTRSSRRLEEIAGAAPEARHWFQVYVLRDRSLTAGMVELAAAAGYEALVLTGDTPFLGRKRRDARNGFAVPEEHAVGNLSVPRHSAAAQQDPAVTLDDIGWLKELSGLPVVVKGVLRADDARRCLDAGAAGVIVSNHGGRQLDGAVATAEALPEVVAEVAGSAPVLVDGGIDSAADVRRALALGADTVLVGRPVAWALAAGGADAVSELLAELGGS
jgi:4-hydroxymandelate oxidase